MKGISAMIATVLVVAFTVAVGAILATWFTGITRTTTAGTESQTQTIIKCANSGFEIISTKKVNATTNEYNVYIFMTSKDVKIYPKTIIFSDGTVNTTFTANPSVLNSTNTLSTLSVTFPSDATSITVRGLCEYGSFNTTVEASCESREDCWTA